MRPKHDARLGEFYLEEAVLDVLLEARYENLCIGAADISKKAGIFRDGGATDTDKESNPIKSMNDAIVTGILVKLHKEHRVERCEQDNKRKSGGWQLTDKEFEKRREDI